MIHTYIYMYSDDERGDEIATIHNSRVRRLIKSNNTNNYLVYGIGLLQIYP